MTSYHLLGLTTSFPLRESGCAGVFVKRLYEHLPTHWKVNVVCPDDNLASPESIHFSEKSAVRIQAVRYAPRSLQVLAQGAGGVVAGLHRAPWRVALVPILILCLAWRCVRAARSADLIHANWAVCGAIASLVGKIAKRPVVTTLRGDDVSRAEHSWVERRLLDVTVRGSRSIICVSQSMAAQLRHRYPGRADHIHVCLNGIDDAFLQVTRTEPTHAHMRIVAVGSLIHRKGYDLLIDAVAQMQNRKEVRVTIAGDGPQRSALLLQADALGIPDLFDFIGEIAPERMPEFLANADIFAMTSRSEGRPNVVVEALAAGIPVVSTALPGVDGLVEHGRNGWIVDIDDPAGLAVALDRAFANPEELAQCASFARESILNQDCSWDMTGGRYDALFMTALGNSPVEAC